MLVTSAGNDSKSFVPRIRRNRKGSVVVLQTRKSLAWHAGRASGETDLEEQWSQSQRAASWRCQSSCLGEPARAVGSGGGGLHLHQLPPSPSPAEGSNGLISTVVPAKPAHSPPHQGFGWPLSWKSLASEPREPGATFGAGAAESASLRGEEGEGCRDPGTRGCFQVCTGLRCCVGGLGFGTCREYRRRWGWGDLVHGSSGFCKLISGPNSQLF